MNAALLQRLRSNDSSLTNLKVTVFYTFVTCYLSHALRLTRWQITKAIFKPAVALDFFSALTAHQHLERLDLDCVGLGMELGAQFCREVLPRMPKLKILDLKVAATLSTFISVSDSTRRFR